MTLTLGQEKIRQQRKDFYSQGKQRSDRKPRTLFELIQMLKERGNLRAHSAVHTEHTEFTRITERSRLLSERSKVVLRCKVYWIHIHDL